MSAATSPSASIAWPVFRGGADMVGLAPGRLPPAPRLRWKHQTAGAIKSSPVLADGRLFIGSDDGLLHALDPATGGPLWSAKLGGAVEAPPLLVGESLIVGDLRGTLWALATRDGAVRWRYETGEPIHGSANRLDHPDGPRVLVGSYDRKVHCLDAATGRPLWTHATENYVNGAVAVAGARGVVGGCDSKLHVIDLETGLAQGQVDAGSPIAGGVALRDGRAYSGSFASGFFCIDLASLRLVWRFEKERTAFFSAPAVTADAVIFGGRDNFLYALDRATGRPRWSFRARGPIDSAPVVCGPGVVVGSDDGRLYIVDAATGRETWSYEIGSGVNGAPAVVDGWIFVGALDGWIYAFGP